MHSQLLAPMVCLTVGVIAWAGTGVLIPRLRRAAILDRPNERSSHSRPTPRGGGIAVVAAILAAWAAAIATGAASPRLVAVIAGAALLSVVSWLDDRRGLSPLIRLAAQFGAVALGLAAMPLGAVFWSWLPRPFEVAALTLLWVWSANLFNFMDGIDGLAGSEAAAIGVGLLLLSASGAGGEPALAGAIAAAAIGFLPWNWAPARVFLGDVGSVPLGYLLGYLLLGAATRGHWRAALILPLYFLADATITLARRLLRGDKVWRPHREHFYQQAVRRGLGHAAVAWRVAGANALLIGCAWTAEAGWGAAALGVAAAVVLALLADLAGLRPFGGSSIPAAKPHSGETPR